jgi:hypothetical protein
MTNKKPEVTATSAEPTDTDNAEALADMTLHPAANGALVAKAYGETFGTPELNALAISLHKTTEKMLDGDMQHCEAMLLGQAHALQAIFVSLSRRAAKQEYLNNYEIFLRMALKAQSQCRATLQTLAEMKNPRAVAFVKQANIAHGPQQINNGTLASRAEEHENQQTQLLETTNGERMDTGAAGAASGVDPAMATVGKIDRAEVGKG